MATRHYPELPELASCTRDLITLEDLSHHHHHNVYYDLSTIAQSSCSTSMYLGGGPTQTPSSGMEMELHTVDSITDHSRKRKNSYSKCSDPEDDTGDDTRSVRTNEDSKKQNHSEIEKRRRDKMNTYITELSSMVPMCHAMSRKLDKLTVLRMAVQHLKTIRGAVHSYTEGHYKPAFLSDQELKTLILQAAEGFLFVVGCDRGRILYVSESVSQILNYSQGDLLGQSWFDILHPKDVAKVKEQLSSSDLSPRERLIDAKTMLPVKTDVPQGVSRLCPGARRSFFCRMKCKVPVQVKEETDTTTGCHRRKKQQNLDRKYCVIQCTGYLKSWAPAKIGLEEQEGEGDGEACNLSCLVAVGRVQPQITTAFQPAMATTRRPNLRTIQFISRHAMDGKFLFVDQRATLVLGFLPQELLGTSMYEYYHHEDIPHLAESHKAALQTADRVNTQVYRFRSKEGSFVRLQSEWKSFRNPWTKEIEYLVAKNSLMLSDVDTTENNNVKSESSSQTQGFDFFSQSNGGRDMQRLISTHVEAGKIGRQIAEEVLDSQRRGVDSSPGSSPSPDIDCPLSSQPPPSIEPKNRAMDRYTRISQSERNLLLAKNQMLKETENITEGPITPAVATPVSIKADHWHSANSFIALNPLKDDRNAMVILHQFVEHDTTEETVTPTLIESDEKWATVGIGPTTLSPGEVDQQHLTAVNGFQSQISTSNSSDRQIGQQRGNGTLPRPSTNNSPSSMFSSIRNNVQLSIASDQGGDTDDMMDMISGAVLPESPNPNASNDGNDEAAMAVIMSLLEADAGLGGPVDFSGLPWPLP